MTLLARLAWLPGALALTVLALDGDESLLAHFLVGAGAGWVASTLTTSLSDWLYRRDLKRFMRQHGGRG